MTVTADVCRCCGKARRFLWRAKIIGKSARYFECPECEYVQTERPAWLQEAYSVAINASNTGIMARNLDNARIVLATMLILGTPKGNVVNCAGGYGILVRILRDYGLDTWWSDRYCENLLARGFAYDSVSADLVTAFKAFEHFENPASDLDDLPALAPNVLFSTLLIPDPAPSKREWWYYGLGHGQHIGFFRLIGIFRLRTQERLAEERGKFLLSDGRSFHLINDRPVSHALWRVMMRARRLLPFLLRDKLKSKTWDDHLRMSGRIK